MFIEEISQKFLQGVTTNDEDIKKLTDFGLFEDEKDIIFYTQKDDWRKEVRHCPWTEFDGETMHLCPIKVDDLIQINRVRRLHAKNGIEFVYVRKLGDNFGCQIRKSWKDFDPTKFQIVEETQQDIDKAEINLKEMLKAGKGPGILTTRSKFEGNRGSMFHNHKLDEGAMGDLIDKGLDGAMKRAEQREKKHGKGHAWQAKSFGRRIVNGRKGKRHR